MAWEFYKDKKTDKVWQVNEYETIDGEYSQSLSGPYFSFDKENPYWADFMKDRKRGKICHE